VFCGWDPGQTPCAPCEGCEDFSARQTLVDAHRVAHTPSCAGSCVSALVPACLCLTCSQTELQALAEQRRSALLSGSPAGVLQAPAGWDLDIYI